MSASTICPHCGRPQRLPAVRRTGEGRACGNCRRSFVPDPGLHYRSRGSPPAVRGWVGGLFVLTALFVAAAAATAAGYLFPAGPPSWFPRFAR